MYLIMHGQDIKKVPIGTYNVEKIWGDRWGSNPRPSEPQSDALTKLSYYLHELGSKGNAFCKKRFLFVVNYAR